MVEFAFVMVLFFLLIFGIISFGVLLAFKQNMTQAASESARASIAVVDDDTTTSIDERKDVALASMEAEIGEFNRECGTTAYCLVKIHDCITEPDPDFTGFKTKSRDDMIEPDGSDPANACLSTRIEFENDGSSRILPAFPLVSKFEPDTLSSQTTVRLVPVPSLAGATAGTTTTTTAGP